MKFLDTNVLLYAISTAPAEQRKADVAVDILGGEVEELALSTQVLQEFYVQASRRGRGATLAPALIDEYLDHWMAFRTQDLTQDLVRATVRSSRRYTISYWDAAIIEAARTMGCDTVLSEDLSDGQSYGGVRVVNPFRVGR